MKNNIFYTFFLIFIFLNLNLTAQELEISSSNVQYDDQTKITIFEGGVIVVDEKGNKLFSEYAKYNKLNELIETVGPTKIITSGGYEVLSANINFDNKKKLIQSNYKTQIIDTDGNKTLIDMFDYSILTSIFFSKGNIKVYDVNNNNYNFSEIYIDEKNKKIIGSDVKAFLNQDDISISDENEPRFFANAMVLSENISTFEKGIFTYCKNRKNDKCPPWTLQSKKIKHDLAKKTIYYDNVILKVYDFPIFFAPKFSHPDATVKRRSGLLVPSLSNSNTLGSGINVPYFWNIADDRDLTITPKIYLSENPLFLTEYRQDFKNSSLIVDAGYTLGYKKKDNKKTSGGRSHFFANFKKDLIDKKEVKSNLSAKVEKVSNDTYVKIHDINTSLVDKNKTVLENSINYTYQNKDFYAEVTPSVFEDISKKGNLRDEYLLPLTIEKNILSSNKYGFVDLASNLRIRNYQVNKQMNLFVNDFNWKSNNWINKLGFENYFEGLVKTVNYEANKTKEFKNDNTNSELNSALGFFGKLPLFKNDTYNKNYYTLTPRFLLRYAPGHMRDMKSGGKLNYGNLYSLDKINKIDVVESGLSATLGFEYKKRKLDKENNISNEVFSFSAGQVIKDQENMDIPSSTSLDQKFSDLVGETNYNVNDKIKLNYNFALDQNYKELNYNEIGTDFNFESAKFNVSYLQEKNHIGNQEYVQSGMDYKLNNSSELSFDTKRNLLTSSAEFYNLSYNYINDCLKAGVAYRREFYTDRDIDATNTLMFTISIVPFAQINSPGLSR